MCDSDKIMAEVNLPPRPPQNVIYLVFGQFVSGRVYETRAQMNAGRLGESEKAPMLQRLLKYRYSSNNELMPDHDIISECMGHLYVPSFSVISHFPVAAGLMMHFRIAGSDTTSITLSYLFWELSRRADVMKKIQSELDEALGETGAIPDIAVLQNLPYLSAFIKEGKMLPRLPFRGIV